MPPVHLMVSIFFSVNDLSEAARPAVLHARLPDGESGINGPGVSQSAKQLVGLSPLCSLNVYDITKVLAIDLFSHHVRLRNLHLLNRCLIDTSKPSTKYHIKFNETAINCGGPTGLVRLVKNCPFIVAKNLAINHAWESE